MTKNEITMIKRISFYILLFFCLILNIVIDININKYISVLENVFEKKIYLTTNIYGFICFIFALISIFVLIDILLIFKKEKNENNGINFKNEDGTYGTANWMPENEMKQILSINDVPGIILGKYFGNIVKLPFDSFFNKNIMVFGSSGSMKTIRIPTNKSS